MRFSYSGTLKKSLTLVVVILLTAVHCGCFDVSCDYFHSGGSISAGSSPSLSRTQIALSPSALREDSSSILEQNLSGQYTSTHILSRVIRRLTSFLASGFTSGIPALHSGYYFLFICIACTAYAFLLLHIRFIHLKDGSK